MNSSASRRLAHILDALWYGCSALETLMVVLALLAFTAGVAGVFPQQPAGLQGGAADRWLASAAGSYPGAGQFLRRAGVFAVFEGPWLRLLLAALAFNIALRLAIQAGALAQLLRGRRYASSRAQSAFRNLQSAIPATVGPLLAFAGALLLLAGLLLSSVAGWSATEIALAPGASNALGQTSAPRLTLEELTGSDRYPIARIGMAGNGDGQPARAGEVAFGRPVRRGSLWIALRSAGQALQASARDRRGEPLLLQSLEPGSAGGLEQGAVSEEIHLLFRQTQAEQEFALPSANLSFRVVSYPSLPEKGIETPVFLVEAYRGDDPAPVASDLVVDKATLVLNGATFDLLRDRYAIVDVAFLPGLIPFFLGGLAILAGVILSLWSRARLEGGDGASGSPSPAPSNGGLAGAGVGPKHAS
jgi:hypothetical protein